MEHLAVDHQCETTKLEVGSYRFMTLISQVFGDAEVGQTVRRVQQSEVLKELLRVLAAAVVQIFKRLWNTFEVQQLSEQDTAELTVFAASLRFAGEEQG